MCAALAEFVAQQGSLPKRIETIQHGSRELRLGIWLTNRRQEERKGKIAPQLKAAIEAAVSEQLSVGLWAVREVHRSALCSALAAFVEQRGSLPKQRETFQHGGWELRLGSWLKYQREEERKGKIAPQLKAAIEAAAGAEQAGTLWKKQRLPLPAAHWCSALAAFVEQHGRLPKTVESFQHCGQEVRLGAWLSQRRHDEKKGKLAPQLKVAIEATAGAELAGALWETQILPAAEMCAVLAEFVAQQGSLPKRIETIQHGGQELRLGRWLDDRWQDERKGKLAPQLKAAIEAAAGAALPGGLCGVRRQVRPAAELCTALAAFVEQHSRLPKRREAFQHDGRELRLGRRLAAWRTEERKGKLAPQLKAAIKAAAGPQLAGTLWGVQKLGHPAAAPR
eukprot:scaffold12.g7984.t1